jgi:hypothetical protein
MGNCHDPGLIMNYLNLHIKVPLSNNRSIHAPLPVHASASCYIGSISNDDHHAIRHNVSALFLRFEV